MSKPTIQPDKKTDIWVVDSRKLIIEDGLNRREDYGDIKGLAASIKAEGLLEALTCYKQLDKYVVIRGHRRKMALDLLWEETEEVRMVPIMLEKKGYAKEKRVADQISENSGKQFTPWEQAKVYRDLGNMGWSEKDMSERTGTSIVYVRRLLSLANAPQKLINLVRERRVSATFAMDTIAYGTEAIEILIQKAESGELNGHPSDPELFLDEERKAVKVDKITQGDIKPNSVKIFKTWLKGYDKEEEKREISPEKEQFLKWLRKLMNGELTEKQIQNFFR